MKEERLDKILSDTGQYSRAQARAVIRSGGVTVDGAAARDPGQKISRASEIRVGGRVLDTAEFVVYMLHKPADTVSADRAEGPYPPVTDLLPAALRGRGLHCVGRLDADATGLLLLTDDGALNHRITSPRSAIPKLYLVRVDAPLCRTDVQRLADGVTLPDGTAYRPAVLTLDPVDPAAALVTVTEGRFHEVKNLLAACGRHVVRLHRVGIGALRLDSSLLPGEGRLLFQEEIAKIFISNC